MKNEMAELCEALNKCGLSVSILGRRRGGAWYGLRKATDPAALVSETELQCPVSQAVKVTERARLLSTLGVGQNQHPDLPCAEHAGSEQFHQLAMCRPCWE